MVRPSHRCHCMLNAFVSEACDMPCKGWLWLASECEIRSTLRETILGRRVRARIQGAVASPAPLTHLQPWVCPPASMCPCLLPLFFQPFFNRSGVCCQALHAGQGVQPEQPAQLGPEFFAADVRGRPGSCCWHQAVVETLNLLQQTCEGRPACVVGIKALQASAVCCYACLNDNVPRRRAVMMLTAPQQ